MSGDLEAKNISHYSPEDVLSFMEEALRNYRRGYWVWSSIQHLKRWNKLWQWWIVKIESDYREGEFYPRKGELPE